MYCPIQWQSLPGALPLGLGVSASWSRGSGSASGGFCLGWGGGFCLCVYKGSTSHPLDTPWTHPIHHMPPFTTPISRHDTLIISYMFDCFRILSCRAILLAKLTLICPLNWWINQRFIKIVMIFYLLIALLHCCAKCSRFDQKWCCFRPFNRSFLVSCVR